MATVIKDLGAVTAYAYAVEGGYTGTEEEFAALLGNIADDLSQIENLSVTVTTLPAGSSATASYSNGVLALGIPKGDKGDKGDTGATPAFTIGTVTTLAAGNDASASITGTASAPVLNLGIPKGADGDVSSASMATAYSTSATYAVGDYVWYSGQLYCCTTAISTAESWTAAHWTAVKLAEDVGNLKSALDETITVDWWNLTHGYKILEATAINGTNVVSSASQFSIDGEIPAEAGKTYYAYCDGNASFPTVGARFVNFLNSNKELISTLNSGSNNTRMFTAPANTAFITITFTYASGQKDTFYLTDKAADERIDYYNTDGKKLKASDVSGLNVPDYEIEDWNLVADCSGYRLEKGKYYNGNTTGTGSFFTVLEISVLPGTTYYAECAPNPASTSQPYAFARFLNFYDETKALISTISYPENVFKTPDNAHFISVTLVNASKTADTISLSDFTWYITSDPTKTSKIAFDTPVDSGSVFGLPHVLERVRMGDLLRAEHRIATINFQFDDGTVKDADIASIFGAHGIPCGFALISTVDQARVAEYMRYQERGFEILSHSTDTTGMNDTSVSASVIEGKLKASKKTLTGYGFNVRGWVTPYSVMAASFAPLVAKYYDFGTTISYGEYPGTGTPYQTAADATNRLFRVSLQSTTLANQKKAVDEAIAHNGFLTFYGHAADLDSGDNETTANINELLSYIKAKADDLQCYVLKPSDAVDYYFHPRHSDLLALN